MPTPHTFTIPVAIRNLLADMNGDDAQGSLPPHFFRLMTMAMLRLDSMGIVSIRDEMSQDGWTAFVSNDGNNANKYKLAMSYAGTAFEIVHAYKKSM
jgi:hypothetical protein